MSDYSIEISGLKKVYRLYYSSGARLKEAFNFFGRKYHTEFTALQGIDLKIKKGETFSLIGRNGAGKSTLLKILAGVVSPTEGNIKVNGRIVALLELGAGFNPEMTGTENIYLFGAFHGFSRAKMAQKYDRIVNFADIGEFINFPVKTYSSGMFVRLAFACSIHLSPDILVVDEALSVGDARFQKKCFKFIEELKAKGTTIVLVSHDLSLIKMVSDRACLIENGKLLMVGLPKDVANKYFDLDSQAANKEEPVEERKKPTFVNVSKQEIEISPGDITFGQGVGVIHSVTYKTDGEFPYIEGQAKVSFTVDADWDIDKIEKLQKDGGYEGNLIFGVSMSDRYGNYIFGMTTVDKEINIDSKLGRAKLTFDIQMPELKSDDYLINASLALGKQSHHTTIAWYEAIHILQFRTKLKNVYGWMHPDYQVKSGQVGLG